MRFCQVCNLTSRKGSITMSMYEDRIKRINKEIASLEDKIAKELDTQSKNHKSISSVDKSITKSTSITSARQKDRKINNLQDGIAKAQSNIAKLRNTLASKRSDLSTAEDRLRKEQEKQDDKRRKTELEHEKKLTREARARQQILPATPELRQFTESVELSGGQDKEHDVFIAHASEDKKDFVEPLAHLLREIGLNVWYDDFTLRYGLSLRQQIDKGILNSRRGVVVISHAFFSKDWPQTEFDGMMSIQMDDGTPFVFPIWHDIGKADVAKRSPTLAGIFAASTSVLDIEQMAAAVAESVPGFEPRSLDEPEINVEASELDAEERTLLRGLMNINRRIFKYWYDVAHNYWFEGASAWERPVDPEDALANAQNAKDYEDLVEARDEIGVFASDEILKLADSMAERIGNCQKRLLYEVQRYGISDPKAQGPLWREAQAGTRETFKSQNTEAFYLSLQEHIREQLKR